jgi:ribose 5-phosphate isomerase A
MIEKQISAEKAVEFIEDGMIVGLGTGSTVSFFLKKLGELVKNGLDIKGVSTSNNTTALALSYNIPLISLNEADKIDLTVDGADEVDYDFNGIKGGGGALLFEKIVASVSSRVIWIVDSSKLVKTIGKFPLPVEVVSFGYKQALKKLEEMKLNPKLRLKDDEIYITDSSNYIIDLHIGYITNPKELETELNLIPGVVENGLFINIVDKVIAGRKDGTDVLSNLSRHPE